MSGERRPAARPMEVDVIVEANARPAGEYLVLPGGPLRLSRVHPPAEEDLPGDLGRVAGSADEHGAPVRVIVVGEVSALPGAIVRAQVVGLLRSGSGDRLVVRVPLVGMEDVPFSAADLDAEFARRVERVLGGTPSGWLGAAAAGELVREAIARGRRAAAEQRAAQAVDEAAWIVTPGAQRRWALSETEHHTDAEYGLARLPLRFQLYAREVVLPSERLLASVHRPARPARGLLRRTPPQPEAVLFLTDQQLILLEDAAPPDAVVWNKGFVARATAVERIAGAQQEAGQGSTVLLVQVQAAEGVARWRVPVPAGPALEELVALSRGFIPRAAEHLPARTGCVEPLDENRTGWDTFFGDLEVVTWRERVRQSLAKREALISWALAPAMPSERSATAALALTPERLLLLEEQRDGLAARQWPIGALATIEIRAGLFASELRLWAAAPEPVLRLPFPYTLAPAFLDLFLAVRRRLAAYPLLPAQSAGAQPVAVRRRPVALVER